MNRTPFKCKICGVSILSYDRLPRNSAEKYNHPSCLNRISFIPEPSEHNPGAVNRGTSTETGA